MNYTIIQAILPSFFIAFLGYIYSVKDHSLDMKSIANLIYYVFSPCLVFSSLSKRSFHFQEFMIIGLSVIILIFSIMSVTWLYMKSNGVKENGFYLPVIFMNTGNIALPMALFLYGNEGLSKAIIFHLVNVMFLYSMGIFLVSEKTDLKEFFKIPFLHAAILGVAVACLPLTLPESITNQLYLIDKGIEIIGKGAIPLLIISLGYSLRRTRLDDLKHGVVGAALRLILGPAIAFALITCYRHMGWTPTEAIGYGATPLAGIRTTEAIIILMAAMPAPVTSFLLNEKFEACPETAASMVLIGTLAGVVTIPLILALSHNYILAPVTVSPMLGWSE